MKYLRVWKDLGIYELGCIDEIAQVLDAISDVTERKYELDLTQCIPDYPVTSAIIDRIVSKLELLEGDKELVIVLDHVLSHEVLTNWLFLGSKEFGISDNKSLPFAEISKLINDGCTRKNISIAVKINDFKTGEVIDGFAFKGEQ